MEYLTLEWNDKFTSPYDWYEIQDLIADSEWDLPPQDLLNLYKNFYSYQMHRAYDDETWVYSTTKLVFDIDRRYNQDEVNFEDFSEYRILFYIENDIVTEIAILNGYFL